MMGRNFLAVALCTLCIFSCITQNAEATQLVYFSDSCGSARAADLNLTAAEVGYVGPAPATGFQLCVIDRSRLIVCTPLTATIDTVDPAAVIACEVNPSSVCPSVKSVPFGFGCIPLPLVAFTNVPAGKKLCVNPDGDSTPTACADLRVPWAGTFISKGVLRGTQEGEKVTKETEEERDMMKEDEAAPKEGEEKEEEKMDQKEGEVKETVVVEEDQKEAEFLPTTALPAGEVWYFCFFQDGAIINCAIPSTVEPWVPTPYPGFSGWYIPQSGSNVNQAFVPGNITVQGLQTAFASAINFFANAILH